MNHSDLDINCAVRRVLVRHWIDLGRISIRTTSGVSHLSGELRRLPNMTPALNGQQVAEILLEIRRAPSVRRINPSFTNWTETAGGWQPVVAKSPVASPSGPVPVEDKALDLTLFAIENDLL